VVIHMAAQAIVRRSHEDPVGTYATNVLGTANVLEAARAADGIEAVIVVTSDKCYRPRADGQPCVEGDPLGGEDPYSSSKACAELVTDAYRESFAPNGGPAIASARAGNVIGGGDWAADRLVPDAMRAALDGSSFAIRRPDAVRPWQHVLNPLSGYLALVERVAADPAAAGPWNFGPDPDDEQPVRNVADTICELWGNGLRWDAGNADGPAEVQVLRIDSSKARQQLGWAPHWDLRDGLAATVRWFARYRDGDATNATVEQVRAYLDGAPPPPR
jgi:CDP-glucose 4,6-dehydratase